MHHYSNVNVKWNEHENRTDKNLECSKHLQVHFNYEFHWSVLSIGPRYTFKCKILEAYFIEFSLNSQMNSDVLTLFRNGITETNNPKSYFL